MRHTQWEVWLHILKLNWIYWTLNKLSECDWVNFEKNWVKLSEQDRVNQSILWLIDYLR